MTKKDYILMNITESECLYLCAYRKYAKENLHLRMYMHVYSGDRERSEEKAFFQEVHSPVLFMIDD